MNREEAITWFQSGGDLLFALTFEERTGCGTLKGDRWRFHQSRGGHEIFHSIVVPLGINLVFE